MLLRCGALLFLTCLSLSAAERTAATAITPVAHPRHEAFLDQIREAKGAFDLVLIGDSITDWWPKKGADSYAQMKAWRPLNLGISGERTEQVLWRLLNGELDGIAPKVAMVMIGTNNLGHSGVEKPEWTAAGVAKIVETIRAKLPKTRILLLGIFPRSLQPTDPIRKRVTETNALIAKLDDGAWVRYRDITPVFLAEDGTLPKDVMPDGLHPNEEGYRRWWAAVKDDLTEWMR